MDTITCVLAYKNKWKSLFGGKADLNLKLYKKYDLRVRITQKDLENHFKHDIDMALTLESITL